MKKIFLVLVAMFCVATVSAQSKNTFESSVKNAAQTVASQKWSVGGRLGTGLQVVAECFYAGDKYVEGRFGMQYVAGLAADFTALHNWNVCTMDWTPSAGKWFFDAGVGVNVGGAANVAYVGVAGMAKLGIKFNNVPLRLSFDFTPSFGPIIGYAHYEGVSYHSVGFFGYGICNFGVSAAYCF
uniref:hypothetical protein n=1 Tax=Alistipes sp. TaxID=1872444 RepID=UPI0040568425